MTSTTLASVLADVFDRGQTIPQTLSREEEAAVIADAKAGSSDAIVTLIRLYGQALRNATARHRETLGAEEAQAVALAALVEAVHTSQPGERLAVVIGTMLRSALTDAASANSGFTVPPRTVKRFFSILRAANGDTALAADLAPSYEMTRETFLAVLDAVRHVDSIDDAQGNRSEAYTANGGGFAEESGWARRDDVRPIHAAQQIADAEDADLVDLAFDAVDGLEEEVVRLAYGFSDYEPVADAEIGFRLGYSRPKVQRVRSSALDKMRVAVGA